MAWVDLSQAAFTLGVSERTIRNWIKSGKLQARSVNGRREVEIPDPDDAAEAHVFTDDEETDPGTGAGGGTQKRLEVALIECGRVKGTLASQERIMENLSANIEELNAKLQQKERVIARRTLWAVIVAFLGIIAWLGASYVHNLNMREVQAEHFKEQNQQKKTYETSLQDKVDDLRDEKEKAVADVTKSLHEQHQARITELKADHQKQVDVLRDQAAKLQEKLEAAIKAETRAEAAMETLQVQLKTAQDKLDKALGQAETYRTRAEEAEQSRREIEKEFVEYKIKHPEE